MILLAPALNQKKLLRYWYVKNSMKYLNSKIKITWKNYKKYLNEKEFQKFCLKKDRMTDKNYVSDIYYLENKSQDYLAIMDAKNIFIINGNDDDVVPIESLENKKKIDVIVKNGDHDLERPDMVNQWKNKAIKFLIG